MATTITNVLIKTLNLKSLIEDFLLKRLQISS